MNGNDMCSRPPPHSHTHTHTHTSKWQTWNLNPDLCSPKRVPPPSDRLLPRPLCRQRAWVSAPPPAQGPLDVTLNQLCVFLGFHFLISKAVPLTPVILSHRGFMRIQKRPDVSVVFEGVK